ncbi:MAG: ArnT family glycosyltransferase [Anaerolineae bacterium]
MPPVNTKTRTRTWWILLVLLLLAVFALRVWDLDQVPPGLTHDEASNGHDSAAILSGTHRLYFPVGYGHEPLYNYSVAFTTLMLGQSISTLRITTVFWGVVQCILTLALARRWWGRTSTLGVAAAYAVSFWSLMLARVGLRAPVLPTLLAASALAYDHAITTRSRTAWRSYALAGVFLGASFYTYMASRGMPLLYVIFIAGLALADPGRARQLWRGTALTVAVGLLVAAPLLLYLQAHPSLEQRIAQLGYALSAARTGNFAPLWRNVTDSLPLLLWRGDPQWLYNIAGRPGLEPLLSGVFLVGLVVAILRWQDRRNLYALVWLVGGLAPALLAPIEYNLLHAIGAMPPTFLLIGLGARTLASATRRAGKVAGPWLPKTALAGGIVALLATGAETANAYFNTWAEHRDVRVAYHHHVVALADHLDQAEDTSPAVITSLYPGELHDPYTMEVALRRDDLRLRWADGRRALFVPRTTVRLFVENQTQPPAQLWAYLEPHVAPSVTLQFREIDIPSSTVGFVWDAPATWDSLATALSSQLRFAEGNPPPGETLSWIHTPVDYGGVVSLAGYKLGPDGPVAPGQLIELLTVWEVQSPISEDLAIFAHLLDAAGELVTQDDRLDAPSWQWETGDRFVQRQSLQVPSDATLGSYYVALGIYTRDDVMPLAIRTGGQELSPGTTRVLIPMKVVVP